MRLSEPKRACPTTGFVVPWTKGALSIRSRRYLQRSLDRTRCSPQLPPPALPRRVLAGRSKEGHASAQTTDGGAEWAETRAEACALIG